MSLTHIITMYINHRPAFGLDPYEIYKSFNLIKLGYDLENEDSIPRHLFFDSLQRRGENMTNYELADCIADMMHVNRPEEINEDGERVSVLDAMEDYLPDEITIDKFMSDIVGVPSENFEEILAAWENIRQANIPKTARKLHE